MTESADAHAMRGLHSTLAVDSGITSHAVAAALGHESFKTTAESYAQRDAVASAQQKRVLGVLQGGRLLNHSLIGAIVPQSFPKRSLASFVPENLE